VDTFDLLPSLAAGDLSETSAAELVAAIFRSRASGTLALEGPAGEDVRVFFRAGAMCGCAYFSGFQTLAQVLLANEWLGALEIDETRVAADAQKKRHGQLLVERGLLTPEELNGALATQHQQNLAALLVLDKGRYEWRGWAPPPDWAREVMVDPVAVIAGAFESDGLEQRRGAILGWLAGNGVRLSGEWAELSQRIVLSEEDMVAAQLLATPHSLADFVATSGLPPLHAEALLVALLLAGCVEPHPIEARTPGAPRAESPRREQPPPRLAEDEAIARLEQVDLDAAAEAEAELEPLELDRGPGRAAGGDLDGKPDDPLPGFQSARGPPPAPEGPGEGRDTDVRRRLLARGLRNLGHAPSGRAAVEGAELEATPTGGVARGGAGVSPEEQRFIDEVRSRAVQASRQDPYQRLGVDATASGETIRASYLQLVKRFHPDRAAAPGLHSVAAELRALFDAIKDAYETIGAPAARAAYDQNKGTGAAKRSRAEESRLAVKMGEVLLKKRDFAAALTKLHQAVELDANADSLAALSWGLMNNPAATAESRQEAASLIQRALRAPGPTARTYYVAGVVFRAKDPESAAEAFRKALEMEPGHAEAALELRLLEMRGKTTKTAGGGVLSGLLFGKRKG
jgi:curved DNA-binding protein CbpA